jgi:histone-lysine N-methyltransferase SETMAR
MVFWARKAVLIMEFMQQRTTVTSEMYCKTLKELHRNIQNKRHGIVACDVVLLHDNARPHTAARTQALLEHLNLELFDHCPYSPDLAPSDCHLFTYLKNWLGSQFFNNNEEFM